MTTNPLTTNQDIKAAFSGLFDNRTEQDRRDDAAQLLSFRYLSEVERLMVERGLTKRDLAKAVGASASYITQLFRGDRLLNFDMLARLESALDVTFVVEARQPIRAETDTFLKDQIVLAANTPEGMVSDGDVNTLARRLKRQTPVRQTRKQAIH